MLSAASVHSDCRPRKLLMLFTKPNESHYLCLRTILEGSILGSGMLGKVKIIEAAYYGEKYKRFTVIWTQIPDDNSRNFSNI